MKYQEYAVYPKAGELTALVEALSALGLDQLVINDPKDAELFEGKGNDLFWDYIDEDFLASCRANPSVTFYLGEKEALPSAVSELLRDYDVSRAVVDDEDWLHKWEEYYVPIRLSERVVAKPVWREYEPKDGDIVIDIDPGLAFGTGTSPTTYLAVRLMDKYFNAGDDMLDVGCGTGILTCLGAALGASRITALDLDPEALISTKANIALNGCENKVTVIRSNLLKDTDEKADALIANLTGPLILDLCPDAASHCKNRGLFIASGIIDTMEEKCVEAIEEAGFEVIDIARDEGWSAIAATRDLTR